MVGASIFLAGLFLYLALRRLDWDHFVAAIRNADYQYLPLLFLWGSLTNWIRAVRWKVLLNAEKEVPIKSVFWANMAGYLGNNIFPARAGEWIRAAYISKENSFFISYSLATGLVERFIDLIALVVLGSIAITIAGILSPSLQEALKVTSAIAILGVVALVLVPYLESRLNQVLVTLPILNEAAKARLEGLLGQFLRGVQALHDPKRAAAFVLLTCLIWLLDGIGVVILAHALHLRFTLTQSFLLLAALGLSSAIPSTPGYVGVYQFVAVIVLQPFGVSNTSAIAFIVFLQVINLLILAFWGGLAFWRASSLTEPKS